MIQSIDKEKCIGCGTCQKSCPLDVFRVHADPALASPCAAACPIHNGIREYHSLLQLGQVENATALMWQNNPLAAITGRVCPHLCESECSRGAVDSAVNIAGIERFLGDRALELPPPPAGEAHIFPVAVVGSGPSGLACAAELAGQGFRVTVFESSEEAGGMLRYGIPEYRLPPAVLSRLLEKMRAMGVSFRCGQGLGRDFSVQDLKDRGYGAVFLGLGACVAKQVAVEGADGEDVAFGLDFLKAVRTRAVRAAAGRAIVVGGGDVAMDVAQSLARLGAASVTVVCLEGEGSLPAFQHNIDDAIRLGVRFEPASSVRKVLREGGRMNAVELVRCVRVFDEQGRFAPQMDETRPRILEGDSIVFAIGQACDPSGAPEEIRLGAQGLAADAVTGQTALPWLFAAGDAVSGPASAAAAIGGGKRAARGMALFLRGGDLGTLTAWDMPVSEPLSRPDEHRPQKRQEGGLRQAENGQAEKGFAELHGGLAMPQALAESNRCLTCGSKAAIDHPDDCMTCFTCELYCPGKAISVSPIKEAWPRALAPLPKAD